jgi:hypothetical protein
MERLALGQLGLGSGVNSTSNHIEYARHMYSLFAFRSVILVTTRSRDFLVLRRCRVGLERLALLVANVISLA